MNKKQKIQMDRKSVLKYKAQLEARRKEYVQYAQAYSGTGRRMRSNAVGECVLQLMESLRELNREKTLVEGSLFWTINEQKVKDTDGKKGYHYLATWHVKSTEPYYTKEEIEEEIHETYKKMLLETDEMYSEQPAEEQPE